MTLKNLTSSNIYDLMLLKAPKSENALTVANVLVERHDFFHDLPNLPTNGGRFHEGLRMTSLPSGELVEIGGTWGSEKATMEKFVEGICRIRSSWEPNVDHLKAEGPAMADAMINLQRDAFIEGLGQAFNNLVLKGTSAPQQNALVGLMRRPPWNTYDNEYCYSIGGSGDDLRSAWMIKPSPLTVHLLHNPLNPTLGVEMEEKGESRIASGAEHNWIFTVEFLLEMGFCIRDQRAVKRLCNIPCAVTDDSGYDVIHYAIMAANKHGTLVSDDTPWFLYCDRDLHSQLIWAAESKTKVYMSDKNIFQTRLPMIGDDIIIRRWDSLNCASALGEAVVSAA